MTYLPKIKSLPIFLLTILIIVTIIAPVKAVILAQNAVASPSDTAQMNGSGIGIYQCFQPIQTGTLTDALFKVRWTDNGGSSWVIEYQIFLTTGTFGSTCAPTGGSAAVSGTIDVRTLPQTSFQIVDLVFSGANQITLVGFNTYALVATYVSGSGTNVFLGIGTDTYAGNSGTCQPTCTASSQDLHFTVNGSTTSQSPSQVTQCYGNCGSPPITLTNTNSTHTINFNQSITLFYEFQSNLNGFIVNVTTNFAKNYQPNPLIGIMDMGIYNIPSCPVGKTPFSTDCPGNLISSLRFVPTKGQKSLPVNVATANGQWIGIALTAECCSMDINDTNTNVPLFQTNGHIPAIISTSSSASSLCSGCKMALWAWITGNVVTGIPPTNPPGIANCGNGIGDYLQCTVASFCTGTPNAGCQIAGGIFWAMLYSGVIIMAIMYTDYKTSGEEGRHKIPGAFYFWIPIGIFSIFTALGALPVWFFILEFMIAAYLFAAMLRKMQES